MAIQLGRFACPGSYERLGRIEFITFEGRFAYVPEVGKAHKKEPLSTLLEKCYNSGGIRLRRDFDASKTDNSGKTEGSAV